MRKTTTTLVLILILIVAASLFTCCPRVTKDQAEVRFSRLTRIAITSGMTTIGFKSHRSEFGIGIKLPQSKIEEILNGQPPFGGAWERGPVKGEIGIHCAFIYSTPPGYGGLEGEHQYEGGSPEAIAILSNADVIYCATNKGPDSIPWHGGTLLIVDPSEETVWLSDWSW